MTHTQPLPDDPAHMDYTVDIQTSARPTPEDITHLDGRINCPICEHIEWQTDAGHGWLRIGLDQYAESEIVASPYSYFDDTFAYLEEDVDAGKFLDWYAATLPKWEVHKYHSGTAIHSQKIPTRHTNGNSLIRKLDQFPRHPHPSNKYKEARP